MGDRPYKNVLGSRQWGGSAAAEMLDDWRGIDFTSRWEDVGWRDAASEASP